MRVLSVHNYYRESGGEDAVFHAEADLLEAHGVEVRRVEFSNRSIEGSSPLRMLGLAASTVWSRSAAERVGNEIRAFQPDVAHFHNTLPLVSPSAYRACRARGVPVVQTLHNYRLICPAGVLYRDESPCHDCVGHTPLAAVRHACYRDSRAQSAVVAGMLTVHRVRRSWARDVDLFVAPSEALKREVVAGGIAGLEAERIVVKPHFLSPDPGVSAQPRAGVFFAGRLVPSKGVDTLLRAWLHEDIPLTLRIAGDGELCESVEVAAQLSPRIEYLGRLRHDEVLAEMARSMAVVFPSTWEEPFGLVMIEALASGTPVIASRAGAFSEIARDGVDGLLFEPGDAAGLAAQVRRLCTEPALARTLGAHARRSFEARYTAEQNFPQLLGIYERVMGPARASRTQYSVSE
ncbi:MAG: glycosyltransferase [Dehalococcoidia bacterium]|nr:glycosyltransferase [Dehalococcoidia bacterium]